MDAPGRRPRVAWFSPLPPARTGIAAYTAELLPHLERDYAIETFDEARAHEFAWRARRQPYALAVYHLGNARYHDFMWGYLAAYPGLVVLHDARLHHARARQLLAAGRDADYRREFRFDHPQVRPEAAEYAVAAMGGPVQYLWPMRRVVLAASRRVAVHNAMVADELRREHAGAAVDVVRMGVPAIDAKADARFSVRARHRLAPSATVFAAFGKMTAEKRIGPIVRALGALAANQMDVHLLLVGEDGERVASEVPAGLAARVHSTGYVPDEQLGAYLAGSDVCVCLRWPTALETSSSWLRCLAAARATIVSDLAHTSDVPTTVARRVDLLEEERSLEAAMRELATDARARADVANAGHAWWSAHHTMELMAADYRAVIARAIATAAPAAADLPQHFLDDYSAPARELLRRVGAAVDLF